MTQGPEENGKEITNLVTINLVEDTETVGFEIAASYALSQLDDDMKHEFLKILKDLAALAMFGIGKGETMQ